MPPLASSPLIVSRLPRRLPALLLLCLCANCVWGGPLRDALKERKAERFKKLQDEKIAKDAALPLPAGVTARRDLAYGNHPLDRLDVYRPTTSPESAPIILMVHGGAWKIGDKVMAQVVENKIQRWVTRGFVFVSVNYPMLPEANPLQQAEHVARALAYIQTHAADFHGDPARVILMGHSAGAHLVTLLTVQPALAAQQGAQPWLGTVSLDSAAYNVVEIMEHPHLKLYDEPFGQDAAFWKASSPCHLLTQPVRPILAVCSSQRGDSPAQASQFAELAKKIGSPVTVQPEDLTHKEINANLGRPGAYTEAVEAFLRTLDPVVAARLAPQK